MTTGLVYHDIYLDHFTGRHPENRLRVENTVKHFKDGGLWDRFSHVAPRAATEEEIAWAHDSEMITYARRLADEGGGYADMDTPISDRSYEAALMAAGGLFSAVDAVLDGAVDNAMCLPRPPGHHATPERSMGFCIFNNVALAALHARRNHGLSRVLIVDFDVHHGNGTQDIFYADPSVLFFSLHRYPFYPGTGSDRETGAGEGEGYTVNVPLGPATTSQTYMEAFHKVMDTRARDFDPDLVLVSAGFDGYVLDPLGAFCLEADQFRAMTRSIRTLAEETCSGRVVSTLEGGYNLDHLPGLIEAHAEGLMGP